MKKIVHMIDSLAIGGAQTHLLTILKCANRKSYTHTVFSLTGELEIGREIEELGIGVISLNLQEALKKRRWGAAICTITKMLKDERPDILETHMTWSRILGCAASLISWRKKIVSFEQGDIYNNNWKYRIANFLASFFIDVMITNSNAMKNWIIKNYGITDKKIIVMYNSILTDFFKPKGDYNNIRKALGLSEDEIIIGSVGTLGKGINKGMNYCIEAMTYLVQKYKNIRLIIVGDGELKGELEKMASNLGLGKIVKFLGSRRDIDLILNALDIVVFASPFEPCGIALIEAMSTGKPVVGSASGGIKEIIQDGITGLLFTLGDAKSFAEAISRLIENEELRSLIGAKARECVKEKFEARQYAQRLESLYASL
ncbi:MAG: glycosyltransferase family 4 protein [Candidatus Omnitrophota bacterium]